MTSMLTSQLSEETLSAALDAFRSALGPDAVIDGEDELREFRDPFAFDRVGRLHGLGGAHAGDGRGDPGDRADRERARGPALDARDGHEQRLRRAGAPPARAR